MTDVTEIMARRAAAIFRGLGFYGDWETDQSKVREQCLRAVGLEDQALEAAGFVIVSRERIVQFAVDAGHLGQHLGRHKADGIARDDGVVSLEQHIREGVVKAMLDAADGNGGG